MAQEIADSTLLDTWGSSGAKIEPDISKIIEGWQLGEQPPHEYMNWLQNTFGSKLNHILKNGVASWNNTTQYLAGSSVQHNGNVWLCKATNTNSEPADVNANWKRIITVESLTTVLNGYVATTGDQDIDDVKTFLKSPIVPTPTTGTQAVNKDYVDDIAGGYVNFGIGEQKIPTEVDLNNYKTGGFYITPATGLLNLPAGEPQDRYIITVAGGDSYTSQNLFSKYGTNYTRAWNGALWSTWAKVWDGTNDGAGSGLDADLLDGLHASAFLRDSSLNLNQNGYEILTNGKIECWGVATIGDNTTLNINFPVSFNTQCFGVKLSLNSDGGINADSFSAYDITNSGFTLKSASSNTTNTIYWEAKGK